MAVIAGLLAACDSMRVPFRYAPNIDWAPPFRYSLNYRTYRLPNQLTVVLAPDEETNIVTVDVRYSVGSLDEAPGRTGLAHLVEHASFHARASAAAPSVLEQLDASSLAHNGSTNYESTHYWSLGLASRVERLLQAEAERMTASCGQISDVVVAHEKKIVLQENAQRFGASDGVRPLYKLIWGADHRLSVTVGGDDVAALDRSEVCGFLERHYTPSRATLIIGGAFEAEQVRALVTRHFAAIPNHSAAHRLVTPVLPARRDDQPTALPVEHSTALVIYPLAPPGTRRRTIEELALELLEPELRRAEHSDGVPITRRGARILGRGRHAFAMMYYETSRAAALEQLAAKLLSDVEQQSDRLRLLEHSAYFALARKQQATKLLALHDSLVGRGKLLGDAAQFGDGDYLGGDVAALLNVSARELANIAADTFRRGKARVLRVVPAPAIEIPFSFATGGEEEHEEPLRGSADLPRLTSGDITPRHAVAPIERTLGNGLRMILVPRRRDALLHAELVFPVGRAADPAGKAGLARYTASFLDFAKTPDLAERAALINAFATGMEIGVNVDFHRTSFWTRGNPAAAPMMLWFLHTLLERGAYDQQRLLAIQRQLADADADADADAERLEPSGGRRLRSAMLTQRMGRAHPHARTRDDELRFRMADLEAFRAEHYVARGALLVVVGDLDPFKIAQDITTLWAPWPARPRITRELIPPFAPEPGPRYLALDVMEPQIRLVVLYTARSSPRDDAAVRRIAAELVAARLSRIREQLATSYGVDVAYLDSPAGSLIEVEGKVAPDRAAESLRTMLEDLRFDQGSGAELAVEVERARRKALERVLAKSSSSSSRARALIDAASSGLPAGHSMANELAHVTATQVADLLRRDFDRARMTVAASGPRAVAAMREAGLEPLEVVE